MVITNGELRDYWKKLADAVSGNKMNVSEADVLTALMALGQKIEDVENELTAIRTTDGIKKIEETVPVELKGSNVKVPVPLVLDQTLNMTSGATKTVAITPPDGEIWRVKLLRIDVPAPSGATTGSHLLNLRYGGNATQYNILTAASLYGDPISISYNTIRTATASGGKLPADEMQQQQAILSLVLSSECPLIVQYQNSNDGTQTGTLTLRIVREVEYIV